MIAQLLAIIRNTFVESLRQPIMMVLIIAGAVFLVLGNAMVANTLDDDNVLMVQVGLSILLLLGMFMAAFTATGVLSMELENKTVLTVVSKPVTRPLFILGKYLGVAGAMTVAMWPSIMIFLLCLRHGVLQTASDEPDVPVRVFGFTAFFLALIGSILGNYLYRWIFVSTGVIAMAVMMTLAYGLVLMVDKHWGFQSPLTEFRVNDGLLLSVFIGLLLLYELLLIICAIAIAVSTRLGQVLTIMVTVGMGYLIAMSEGWFGGMARADTTDAGPALKLWAFVATILYHVLPNLQFLWLADDLSIGTEISGAYVLTTSAYSGLFILAILALAVALFQTREVG